MDTSKKTPPEERGREEQAAANIRDRITSLAKMYGAMKQEPDLSEIWSSGDFSSLPVSRQREIREWTVTQGYAKAEEGGRAASEQKEAAADDPKIEAIKARIGSLKKMYGAMKSDPDLSSIWDSDEFSALPFDAQQELMHWAEGGDAGAREKTAAAEPRSPEPAVDRSERTERTETRETKEGREEKKRDRKFIGYKTEEGENGGLTIIEDFEVWDERAGERRQRTVPTSIAIPGALAERMRENPEVRDRVLRECVDVRRELDSRRGMKIYFDGLKKDDGDADGLRRKIEEIKNRPELLMPKWKFTLDGKWNDEKLTADFFPPHIIRLVIDRPDGYHTDPAWRKWFGPQLQMKREQLISAELGKRFPEAVAPAPPDRAFEPLGGTAERAAKSGPLSEEKRGAALKLAEGYAGLFQVPSGREDVGKMTAFVIDHVGGVLQHNLGNRPAEGELREIAHEALLARFAGEPDALAMIEKEFAPPERPAEEAAEKPAEKPRGDLDPVYLSLRQEAEGLATKKELKDFERSLEEYRGSAVGAIRRAAERLLLDIEFGRMGPLSEEAMEGVKRGTAEKRFFAEHRPLDKRNIQRLEDGRLIVHIDPLHEGESILRALERLVDDAVPSGEKKRGETVADLATKLQKVLMDTITDERFPDEGSKTRFREHFLRELAEYRPEVSELVVKDFERLRAIIAKRILKDT